MKIAFFSDIHGVPKTLQKFFDHSDALGAELLVLLGDALYHGPRNGVPVEYDPKKVAEMLNSVATASWPSGGTATATWTR